MAVNVDNDFARFGSKSYAINKINSVEVRERKPHGKMGSIICGLIGIFLLLGAFGTVVGGQTSPAGTFVFAAIFFGFAYWQWQRSKIREYLLFLMTSSSETQAFVTRDQDEVVDLRSKIEGAMLHHSQGSIRAS